MNIHRELIVVTLVTATLALTGPMSQGQVVPFGATARWTSDEANFSRALALGDIDRDGHMDVVFGNLSQPNKVYAGVRGFFGNSAVWSSTQSSPTLSVALGDVNGDGYLDLVCGNAGTNALFLNDNGTLTSSPSWQSGNTFITSRIVLADVDGNGELDIVCGNTGNANTLYLNSGGVFATTADWSSSAANATLDIDLADVDGDGMLDLICANNGPNCLYKNAGGSFASTPAWTSSDSLLTTCVRTGDINGDGPLDIVCGNSSGPSVVYLNSLGTPVATASWSSGTSDSTSALALGDVDGDGYLDLVVANESQESVLYLNSAGALQNSPAWTSGQTARTRGVELADVDGDGDLDLIFANHNETNYVVENLSPPVTSDPAWSSQEANGTLGAVLVDIDNDGDLDLVCGNSAENKLYRNSGGSLQTIPDWSSAAAGVTADVAVGDINGDGAPDLIAGNIGTGSGDRNQLYLNTGTTLSPTSLPICDVRVTNGVALGDINGDGLLDLVCGNANAPVALYLNSGGTFALTPDWMSAAPWATTDVALGDIDGDGDLDLACSTKDEANVVFLNEAGTLGVDPAWLSQSINTSSSVALGDIDGDGDIDIAFGNIGQANTVYINSMGVLDFNPAWSSGETNVTSSIALVDYDADGDLDLACGNKNQPNTIYRNGLGDPTVPGLLSILPVWKSNSANQTEWVGWGDVNGDGDMDLVCANQLQPNTLFAGVMSPPYKGNPQAPTRHLVNNSTYCSTLRCGKPANNELLVTFTAVDIEADHFYALFEYQFDGESAWSPMMVDGADGLTGLLASSPAGVVDSVHWDISRLPFRSTGVTVRMKVLEVPGGVSHIQRIPAVQRAVGGLTPTRPQISTPPDPLIFTTVTLGDTTFAALAVTNSGTDDLVVQNVQMPSVEMRPMEMLPLVLAPGATDTLHVALEPVGLTTVTGDIIITSNDPLNPVHTVPVSANIKALDVRIRVATGSVEIPLGEAATVLVQPETDVHIEGGYLYHRPRGTAAFDSIPLAPFGGDFVGVIPGEHVTEAGLEYFVRVDNQPVFRAYPTGAPDDGVYLQPVLAPDWIDAELIPTFEDDYAAGQRIEVRVQLPRGASFVSGNLHYRAGGQSGASSFTTTAVVLDDGVPRAFIPGPSVTDRGVEYWVEVETMSRTLTLPPSVPSSAPVSLPVVVANLTEPRSHPGETYRLFSVPLKMRGGIVGSIADELGGVDPAQWRLYSYNAGAGRYVELPNPTSNSFEQGRSYWLIARKNHRIGTGPDRGDSTPTDRPFAIALAPGYNLVADPFSFPVAWASLLVDSFSVTDSLGAALVENPVAWIPGRGYDFSVATLEPFAGYWINNLSAASVTLRVPPREQDPVAVTAANDRAPASWRVAISAIGAGAISLSAEIGEEPGASDAWDKWDHTAPPGLPDEYVAVYLPRRDRVARAVRLARDIREVRVGAEERPGPESGHIWNFDVAKNYSSETAGDPVALIFDGVNSLPAHVQALLIDNELGRQQNLRGAARYEYRARARRVVSSEGDARFKLLVGTDEFIAAHKSDLPGLPERTSLHANFPNPFNPSTVIRYDVARAGRIRIDIYDIRGTLIANLVDRIAPSGRYETVWNGTGEIGERVASGVYFCRMVSVEGAIARKMVLLK